jgi:hypothetical protein
MSRKMRAILYIASKLKGALPIPVLSSSISHRMMGILSKFYCKQSVDVYSGVITVSSNRSFPVLYSVFLSTSFVSGVLRSLIQRR